MDALIIERGTETHYLRYDAYCRACKQITFREAERAIYEGQNSQGNKQITDTDVFEDNEILVAFRLKDLEGIVRKQRELVNG